MNDVDVMCHIRRVQNACDFFASVVQSADHPPGRPPTALTYDMTEYSFWYKHAGRSFAFLYMATRGVGLAPNPRRFLLFDPPVKHPDPSRSLDR